MSTLLRPARRLLLLSLAFVPACAGDDDQAAARVAFDSFQQALRAGNRETLRDLLTSDSGPAIDALIEARSSRAAAVAVDDAKQCGRGTVELAVLQPDGERGVFVVVRENGRWRVDLIESAARSNGVLKGAGFEVQRGADPSDVKDAVLRGEGGIR